MNKYVLGLAVNIAPFIKVFLWCIAAGFAFMHGFVSLAIVKAYLCLFALMLHVPLAELIFRRTAWHDSPYIHKAWSAMPYLLLLGTLVLVWLFVDQRKARQASWARWVFCISAFAALAVFAVFVAGLRYLAVV